MLWEGVFALQDTDKSDNALLLPGLSGPGTIIEGSSPAAGHKLNLNGSGGFTIVLRKWPLVVPS